MNVEGRTGGSCRQDPVCETGDDQISDVVGHEIGAAVRQRVGACGAEDQDVSTGAHTHAQLGRGPGPLDDRHEIVEDRGIYLDLLDAALQSEDLWWREH